MTSPESGIYEGSDELLAAVSKRCRRPVTAEEVRRVDPDGYFLEDLPYSTTDYDELFKLLKTHSATNRPSSRERHRNDAMARVKREAASAEAFVAEQRQRLFGMAGPPCENAIAAARWIESHQEENDNGILSLEFLVDRHAGDFEQLIQIRDLIDEIVAQAGPVPDPNIELFRWMRADGRLRRHERSSWLLSYFKFDAEGQALPGVYRTRVFPGTLLGDLYEEVMQLAKSTGWTDLASLHHLLTGGLIASRVRSTTRPSLGKRSFRSPTIVLEIVDPESVTTDEVTEAFESARGELPTAMGGRVKTKRRRGRTIASAPVVPFVEKLVKQRHNITWEDIHKEWNLLHRADAIRTSEALRKRYERAKKRNQ